MSDISEFVASAVRMRPRGQRRAVETFRSAQETIGPIERGMHLFAMTRGQFSMIDAILHCLDVVGTASVSVWTWAVADYEVEAMGGLMARDAIREGTLICDASSDNRSPEVIQKWRDRFGADHVRICRNHSKVARVWNDEFRILLRGSMNLNYNPRFEQLDITEGYEDFDLVERIEGELPVLPPKYTHAEVEAASSLGKAFELTQLKLFRGIKPWAK